MEKGTTYVALDEQQATDRGRHPPTRGHGAGAAGDPERPPSTSDACSHG
jgi:hypothetical protein